MSLTRRQLLTGTASQAAKNTGADADVLVCVFQRGGADGLNALVPYADPMYAVHRADIRVPAPGEAGGAIDLDGFFGFHPALAPLKPIYDAGDLALIHATGIPHGSRSHFAAQSLVERGVSDSSRATTGWLGRYLANRSGEPVSAFDVVAISGNVPLTLLGAADPLAIDNIAEFGFSQDILVSGYTEVLAQLFRSPMPFHAPGQAALGAIDELQTANLAQFQPEHGAVYPSSGLGGKLRQASQLIKSTLPVNVICIDSDGWDHHENLPDALQNSLADLAASLSAFYTDMADSMQHITMLVYSEFGRRVPANASRGADHGTAGLAYVLGGGVNGGQVVADWPGLQTENLELGEDLKITTDLRDVLSEMLSRRLRANDLGNVFPGYTAGPGNNLFLTR